MKQRHIKNRAFTAIRTERKQRVTVTLSKQSVQYVKAISVKEQSHVSTVMDRMIESIRRAEELRQLNSEISAFYDALPESAVTEDAAWGQIGIAGLAALVESEDETAPRDPGSLAHKR